jgi:hypothetical protein
VTKAFSLTTESAGTKVRRGATWILGYISQSLDTVALALIAIVAVCGTVHVGPESWQKNGNGWDFALYSATVFGFTQALLYVVGRIAEAIDPDLRDGDMVLDAAAMLKQVREDIANGAELDDVLDCLHQADLGTALADLLAELAKAREENADAPLWSAVSKARDINRLVADEV